MAIVKLLEEQQYSELVRTLDVRVREYTRAAGHDAVHQGDRALPAAARAARRRAPVRDADQVAAAPAQGDARGPVSMVNGCAYCITAHSRVLKRMFDMGDAELVELAATVAHAAPLCRFETATMPAGHERLFAARPAAEVPLLGEIEDALGLLPEYFRIMANDPGYLETVWSCEKATVRGARLERLDKEYVAFATAIASDAPYSVRLRKDLLTRMGAGEEQLFEALEVVELFRKNTKFTEGLQLEAGLSSDSAGA